MVYSGLYWTGDVENGVRLQLKKLQRLHWVRGGCGIVRLGLAWVDQVGKGL